MCPIWTAFDYVHDLYFVCFSEEKRKKNLYPAQYEMDWRPPVLCIHGPAGQEIASEGRQDVRKYIDHSFQSVLVLLPAQFQPQKTPGNAAQCFILVRVSIRNKSTKQWEYFLGASRGNRSNQGQGSLTPRPASFICVCQIMCVYTRSTLYYAEVWGRTHFPSFRVIMELSLCRNIVGVGDGKVSYFFNVQHPIRAFVSMLNSYENITGNISIK